MTIADEIREYVLVAIIKPARRRNERTVTATAGEIADGMWLRSPSGHKEPRNVCQALSGSIFAEMASGRVSQEGAMDSTATRLTFELI